MMLSNPDRSPIGLTTRSPSHCARGGVAYTCCVRGSSPCLSLPEGLAHGRKPWALFGQDFRPDFDIQVPFSWPTLAPHLPLPIRSTADAR
jgi:hypothetical protein